MGTLVAGALASTLAFSACRTRPTDRVCGTRITLDTYKLNCEGARGVTDISAIGRHTRSLTQLNLRETSVRDLSPLAQQAEMSRLDISYSRVQDLRPLNGLTRLQSLDLSNTEVTDLRPLAELRELRELSLRSTAISDLSPVGGLEQLVTIDFRHTRVASLEPLARCAALGAVFLASTPVTDLRGLPTANLVILSAPDTGISDISLLDKAVRLEQLYLERTRIVDLSPLTGLRELAGLFVNDTRISDLSPLRASHGLYTLDISRTRVTNLEPLSGLELRHLVMNGLAVSSLRPLHEIASLSTVFLDRTLPPAELDRLRKARPDLKISFEAPAR